MGHNSRIGVCLRCRTVRRALQHTVVIPGGCRGHNVGIRITHGAALRRYSRRPRRAIGNIGSIDRLADESVAGMAAEGLVAGREVAAADWLLAATPESSSLAVIVAGLGGWRDAERAHPGQTPAQPQACNQLRRRPGRQPGRSRTVLLDRLDSQFSWRYSFLQPAL